MRRVVRWVEAHGETATIDLADDERIITAERRYGSSWVIYIEGPERANG